MDEQIALATRRPRFSTTLLTVFAAMALLLAALGIYGVMSFSVSLRTREIGLRMALGARATDVLRLVLRDGLVMTAFGIGIGALGALAATRVLTSLLYEVNPSDPRTYLVLAGVLVGVAVLASTVPALRASRVEPTVALRHE